VPAESSDAIATHARSAIRLQRFGSGFCVIARLPEWQFRKQKGGAAPFDSIILQYPGLQKGKKNRGETNDRAGGLQREIHSFLDVSRKNVLTVVQYAL
jgi:uncharacterized phosphosugar-binding protein